MGAHDITFEAFGVRVRLVADRWEDLDGIAAVLPPGSQPCDAGTAETVFSLSGDSPGTYELQQNGTVVARRLPPNVAVVVLEAKVRALVARDAPDHIFVHAGAVAHDGRVIVIPGDSYAGKTTLVAALVRAGAVYYSDEYAVLDGDGRVHPFSKPLSLRSGGAEQVDCDVETIGGVAGQEPLPVGAAVVTRYRMGAAWAPRRLSSGEGVIALIGNTVPAQTRPAQALRALTRALEGALVLEGDRGEAHGVAPRLLADLERRS